LKLEAPLGNLRRFFIFEKSACDAPVPKQAYLRLHANTVHESISSTSTS